MGELSRWEDLLKTGSEDTVKPLSRVEAILRDEDITPQSRIEKLLKEGGGGGAVLYDEYEITQNKTKIVPPVGYDGFSSVITNIPDPTLITKNVTTNGEFNAEDDNADGYSSFNVNVPQLFTKVELYQVEYDALTTEEKLDPSKFYVIKPGSPRVYLYKWDFTKAVDPLVDELQDIQFELNKNRDNYPTLNQNGLYFQRTSSNGAGRAVATLNENLFGKTIEIDYGETNIERRYSNEQDFFAFSSGGYIYRDSSVWGLRNASSGGWNDFSAEFGANYFSNKTLKLVVYENSKVDVYSIDGDIETKLNASDIIEPNGYISNKIYLGSGNSFANTIGINFTVKAIRVYENEEV